MVVYRVVRVGEYGVRRFVAGGWRGVLREHRGFFCCLFFFFKQKTAYEIGTGDWSSDVCSSDLLRLKGKNMYSSRKLIMLVVQLVINQCKELKFVATQTVNGCQKAHVKLQLQRVS